MSADERPQEVSLAVLEVREEDADVEAAGPALLVAPDDHARRVERHVRGRADLLRREDDADADPRHGNEPSGAPDPDAGLGQVDEVERLVLAVGDEMKRDARLHARVTSTLRLTG